MSDVPQDMPLVAWIGFGLIALWLLALFVYGIYETCTDPYGYKSRNRMLRAEKKRRL